VPFIHEPWLISDLGKKSLNEKKKKKLQGNYPLWIIIAVHSQSCYINMDLVIEYNVDWKTQISNLEALSVMCWLQGVHWSDFISIDQTAFNLHFAEHCCLQTLTRKQTHARQRKREEKGLNDSTSNALFQDIVHCVGTCLHWSSFFLLSV